MLITVVKKSHIYHLINTADVGDNSNSTSEEVTNFSAFMSNLYNACNEVGYVGSLNFHKVLQVDQLPWLLLVRENVDR